MSNLKQSDTTLETIARYVELKRAEKSAAQACEDLKPVFYAAADKLGTKQIEIAGALVYARELPAFEYPARIKKLEKELETARAAYRAKSSPASVSLTWAVKF